MVETTLTPPSTIWGSRLMRSPEFRLRSTYQPFLADRSTPFLVTVYVSRLVLELAGAFGSATLDLTDRVCCTSEALRMLPIALPVSLSMYSDWVLVSLMSGRSSRRPVPKITTRWACDTGAPLTVSVSRHWVTSGRVVMGWLLPVLPMLTTLTTPGVAEVRSKRNIWPVLSPP